MQGKKDSRESLDAFQNGYAGVDFDTLCRFAVPIFELFGFDASLNGMALSEDEVDDQVAALETARLFWAFFESDGPAQPDSLNRLHDVLFGPDSELEEQAAMSVLVDRLSRNWESLPVRLRRRQSGRPSFDALMSELEGVGHSSGPMGSPSTNGKAVVGDAPVDSPDALAAFASPLLDDPSIDDDPDLLSEMMVRAQDYWHLATLTGDDYLNELQRLVDKHAACSAEKQDIMAEANIMVARFHKLFPHWT